MNTRTLGRANNGPPARRPLQATPHGLAKPPPRGRPG